MNITIMGAGAIGSLFGAKLSKNNNVILIGRKSHVDVINKSGLKIQGKTNLNVAIEASESAKNSFVAPDLLILAVKSYDTEAAMKSIAPMIGDNTYVMSLQNGLDNIEKIEKFVDRKKIMVCITTHGAVFSRPGVVKHTGKGHTILGELNGKKTGRIKNIARIFNEVGADTKISSDIIREIWVKAIINSSINPLTTIFQCKNGYLLENPVLDNIVEKVCMESTTIANKEGIHLSFQNMLKKTKEVTQNTADNYSSMLQSFRKGKKTEINSINGKIVDIGRIYAIDTLMNEILVYLVKTMTV
ncbi:MAG: 2-dehydropantoate 2-reductase [Thermoplasmatales archaeon]|nr:2-dehydropantoate 2-reductase [Thermoplasmatales archaeon]